MIKRKISEKILEASKEYPVIAIVGPRQSGKTTLAQALFPKHKYISLEDLDIREIAQNDPRAFLNDLPSEQGLIIDEIQHLPHLLSYMQTIVDKEKKLGFFIITGSQNFLVDQTITQTLAGRMAVLTLLPLSISELEQATLLPEKIETAIYQGSYPRVYAEDISIDRLYANYIRLYVERDVRQITNVSDLTTFQKFMRLCAGRIGQVLNLTSLGNDCGISHTTARAWLSLLESSYIIFQLFPYFENFGKRVIKSPKLFFYDTGLACSLLKIRNPDELFDHYLRGNLFESYIISDFLKQQYNLEQQLSIYFWNDKKGEIDAIIDTQKYPVPIEIKAGKTIIPDFFKDLIHWREISDNANVQQYLIYGGNENLSGYETKIISWKSCGNLIETIK